MPTSKYQNLLIPESGCSFRPGLLFFCHWLWSSHTWIFRKWFWFCISAYLATHPYSCLFVFFFSVCFLFSSYCFLVFVLIFFDEFNGLTVSRVLKLTEIESEDIMRFFRVLEQINRHGACLGSQGARSKPVSSWYSSAEAMQRERRETQVWVPCFCSSVYYAQHPLPAVCFVSISSSQWILCWPPLQAPAFPFCMMSPMHSTLSCCVQVFPFSPTALLRTV